MNFIEIFSKRKRQPSRIDPRKIGRGEGRKLARLMMKDLAQHKEFEDWLKEIDPEFYETIILDESE